MICTKKEVARTQIENQHSQLEKIVRPCPRRLRVFQLWWWVCRPQVLHCLGELFSIVSAAQEQMIIMALHISLVIEMLAQCTCFSILSNIKWILLLFLFQNSISTPVTVVDVPPILNKTIKSGHHLCFFGVKLRINWFDKLLIITSQPTRGWLNRPK